jgi:hypothetical protein
MKRPERKPPSKARLRKHLNADALIAGVRREWEKLPDFRNVSPKIPIADVAMSAFAMFSLKDPSLLAFEKRWTARDHNLHSLYRIGTIPSDTTMREILDTISPMKLRPAFRTVFTQLQRGKVLEEMTVLDGHLLLALDGTGYFSSEKLHSEFCLEKTDSRTGKTTYYLQMMGAALVHPDFKEVIPLAPEPICREDGTTKNDCERNAAKRFLEKLRTEHPHLKIIVTEDALSPNAPHIEILQRLNLRFILGVKPGDHAFLFQKADEAATNGHSVEFDLPDPCDPDKLHYFRYVNNLPLNKPHPELRVNLLEYWQDTSKGVLRLSWITDFAITRENAFTIMRAGRARWKIENETFNTLKNQGYHLEHNYGLGKKHLSAVFVTIMMLAFLVDQVQQLCCPLFRAVRAKLHSKRDLWERVRALFFDFELESMRMLYEALLYGYKRPVPEIIYDSS